MDVDEDKWFFNSIKRYNELQMFDFPKVVQEMDLSSLNSLCIGFEGDNCNRNEILKFELPLILKTEEKSSKFDRHLSFTHGCFTDSPFIHMKCLPNKENIILSERNGIGLYDINSQENDSITQINSIPCDIVNANISVNACNSFVAICGSENTNKLVVDYESMNIITRICEENVQNVEIIPLFSSANVISFGNTFSGCISLYDIRNGKYVNSITIPSIIETSKSAVSQWIFNTSFDVQKNPSDSGSDLFYLFSTNGNFLIFDSRNLKEALHYSKHPLECESVIGPKWNVKMNMCPVNLNKFSVCGYDENVYICELKNNKVEVIFIHDGHPYSKDEFESGVVTISSMWIPCIQDTVVSCANNESVQCWQYLIK